MKKILVTGGLGFIGSHTVVELQEEGYDVVIVDDLSNSSIDVLHGITTITGKEPYFEQIDLKEKAAVTNLFKKHTDIKGVIHFAASKAVGESVEKPLKYYHNNINTLVYLLEAIESAKIHNFIFSSSCTVYGDADVMPITEETPYKPAQSPYANTKQIGEEILKFTSQASKIKAISLRYFNPIGAHQSAKIGELPNGVPQNLVPFITQTAAGIRDQISVFGNDYDTHDGTAIRDYIHVIDLAQAHIAALKRLINNQNKQSFEVFNIGTGKGSSVLDIIKTFEKATGQMLNYKIVDRREGDVTEYCADNSFAKNELGWQPKLSLENALASAWEWQKSLNE